tara:strand:+ start:3015 stop:4448 length:1434 start_codon:yes stop_codon:yes gene_type:complete
MSQRNSILNFDSGVARIACFCGLFMGLVGSILAQGVGTPDFIQTPVGPVRIGSEVLPVDETEIPDKDHSSAQEEVPRAELTGLIEAQLELQYSVDNQEYDQAIPLAERVVELTKAEFGEISTDTAISISNLAEMQRRVGLHEESGINFLASIELFREIDGMTTPTAILPLVGLGVAYHGLGDYPQALGILEEARSINRRNFGLLNEEQITILDHMSNSLIRMGLYEDAERQKLAGLDIMERMHGPDSVEVIPALYKHARWLRGSSRFDDARAYYVRAMNIIRATDGPESALLAEPLRAIGNSYRAQRIPAGSGISALRRALKFLRSQNEPDKLQIAETLRNIGDWHTAFSKVGPTGNEYREAWDILNELEDGEILQRRWFYNPSDVLKINPSTQYLADPGEPYVTEGYVLVSFDVSPAGQALNVSVLESEPSGFKDEATILSIERSRFRPRMLDGEMVTATGITRKYTFLYVPLSKQ